MNKTGAISRLMLDAILGPGIYTEECQDLAREMCLFECRYCGELGCKEECFDGISTKEL